MFGRKKSDSDDDKGQPKPGDELGIPVKPTMRPTATTPPSRPALQNKMYVAIFNSDGDNLQEDEGLIPLKWADSARGSVPINWTISPALVDVAPGILRYYQGTATINVAGRMKQIPATR